VSSFVAEGEHLDASLGDQGPRSQVEVALFGTVLAFWLELQGTLALHAASVVAASGAVLILGSNGGGKSAIAAAMMHRGLALMSDDIVPVTVGRRRIEVSPSYPQMRMWPDVATHFVGDVERWPLVLEGMTKRRVRVGAAGFGSFCSEDAPPSAIYLPVRRDPLVQERVEIQGVGPAAAVAALVGRSFVPRLTAAAGLQPERLRKLCSLAEKVPVRRIVYPSGLERLDEVAGAILSDLG
jgi:hypothetical protein